ncbi:hypothetical protein [Vibrio splendidus]|uniref:hypothetical protein n=1 Tax=Vibrio splendidus TaxID=29497 RepID=UPI0000670DFA|nr:hypothetical protein [Vibrio splendidus]EAP93464.1 hypothetical protein V12B01_24084 [Vibrio splendidus 12B01]
MSKLGHFFKALFGSGDLGHDNGDGSAGAHATRLIEDPTYRAEMEKLYGKHAVDKAIENAFPDPFLK